MKNQQIQLNFEQGILFVKFLDDASINIEDLKEIYAYGNTKSQGKSYCIIFEATGNYEVSEDAVSYMIDNPDNKNILAKVYVLNSKEAETKTKLHLLFDKPELTPKVFKTLKEGKEYLINILNSNTV